MLIVRKRTNWLMDGRCDGTKTSSYTHRSSSQRRLPAFDQGKGITAEFSLQCPPTHESLTIVIPIWQKRFYYNRKINSLPAAGFIQYGDVREKLRPNESVGSLDWGRGVWEYQGFWSGFVPSHLKWERNRKREEFKLDD